jgi:rubredoxin
MEQTRTVATFADADRANTAADALRDADIDADLEERHAPVEDDADGTGATGVAVRVGRDDEDRAREILESEFDNLPEEGGAEWGDENPFSDTNPEEEEQWEEMTEGLHCPECGSKNVGLGSPLFQAVGTALVISFAAVFVIPSGYRQYGIALWGIILAAFLLGLGLRKFPLVCKECGHIGNRPEFDPTTD